MNLASILPVVLALTLSPLLPGLVNRVKAVFAGRTGPPLLQNYFDLAKLLRKGAVYSRTTTWIFRAGPIVGLAAALVVAGLVPFGGIPAILSFPGDLVLASYLLGLMRFFIVLAALDTGSSFEGMGASREVQFSALAEPALFLALASQARQAGNLSLSGMFFPGVAGKWAEAGPTLALVAAAIFIVLLAENARIPVDDPNTHLELTMIHEVMVLDHSGPDLAYIQYGAALKLWILGSILAGVVLPMDALSPWKNLTLAIACQLGLAILIGIVESTMARLRLHIVPQLLVGAGALSAVALFLVLR